MEAPWIEWESAAEALLDETCTTAPVNAFALAKACHLKVVPWEKPGAELRGDTIYLNMKMRPERQHMRVSHEIGHFALERAGVPDSEPGAWWTGAAMLLPRRDLGRHLTQTAWSLPRLRELHVNASAEAIALRIVQIRDAVATVFDNGRLTRRRWSPWIEDARLHKRRVSRFERELAEEADATGEEVRADALCYAVPIVEGAWRRVIVVCELEQLSFRL